jgi:hypothetical protein
MSEVMAHTTHQYQSQWQAFRKHRNKIALLLAAEFVAFLPFVALVVSVERHLFSRRNAGFPSALIWGALFAFTGLRLRIFPCPRCGKNFFGGVFGTGNVFGRSCANCGLRRYAGE